MTSAVALAVPAALPASQTYRPPSPWLIEANRRRPPAASTLIGNLAWPSFDLGTNAGRYYFEFGAKSNARNVWPADVDGGVTRLGDAVDGRRVAGPHHLARGVEAQSCGSYLEFIIRCYLLSYPKYDRSPYILVKPMYKINREGQASLNHVIKNGQGNYIPYYNINRYLLTIRLNGIGGCSNYKIRLSTRPFLILLFVRIPFIFSS